MTDRYSKLGVDEVLCGELRDACGIPSLEFHPSIDSTQHRARELAAHDAAEWSVVAADFQTAGRGQHGRRWAAAPGSSVMLSVLTIPRTPEALSLIPIRVGLILSHVLSATVAQSSARPILLKWPNDLIANDAKLGGILCEAQSRGEELRAIVGIGINVRRYEPTPGVVANATSLDEVVGENVDRIDVLQSIVSALRRDLELTAPNLSDEELDAYRSRDWLRGQAIIAPLDGIASGINRHGHLLVRTTGGALEAAVAGVVTVNTP